MTDKAPVPTTAIDWRHDALFAIGEGSPDEQVRKIVDLLLKLEREGRAASPLFVGLKPEARMDSDRLEAASEEGLAVLPEFVVDAVREAALATDRDAFEILASRLAKRVSEYHGWTDDQVPADRQWVVDQWLPRGRCGLLVGAGGGGKSKLAMMLGCAVAAGHKDWLPAADPDAAVMRQVTVEAASTVVFCSWEDEPVEAQRRRYWMRRKGGLEYAAAKVVGSRFRWLDMRGHGALWGPRKSGSQHVATMGGIHAAGDVIRRYCEHHGARLCIADPLAAAYASDENQRSLVRAFMADMDAWAEKHDCAVLLIAHPAKAASGYSGSTDWQGAGRFMWEMGLEPSGYYRQEDGTLSVDKPKGSDPKPTQIKAMKLALVKSNYSLTGSACWLRWRGRGNAWEQCSSRQAAAAQASTGSTDGATATQGACGGRVRRGRANARRDERLESVLQGG